MSKRSPLEAIPLGWSYNPSHWGHRLRLLPFALLGVAIALDLTLAQIGWIPHAWDPLFGRGSERVIHSAFSRMLPFPDAAIGLLAYGAESLLLLLGGKERWIRRPWLALLSGLTALALAGGGSALLLLQGTFIRSWCLLCVSSTLLSLFLLQRALAELLACIQTAILIWRLDQKPVHWLIHGASDELRGALIETAPSKHPERPWTEGTSCPWTLFASFCLGAFTIALPDLCGITGFAVISIELAGVMAVAGSLVSMSEPARILRLLNGASGSLLLCWFLGQPLEAPRWIAAAIGFGLIGLSLHRGVLRSEYGIFSSPSQNLRALDRKPEASLEPA